MYILLYVEYTTWQKHIFVVKYILAFIKRLANDPAVWWDFGGWTYEEKIANRELEIAEERKQLKEQFEKDKEDALNELREKHKKEIADIILGRKSVENVQNKEEENDISFFDKAVEDTKKKLLEL